MHQCRSFSLKLMKTSDKNLVFFFIEYGIGRQKRQNIAILCYFCVTDGRTHNSIHAQSD